MNDDICEVVDLPPKSERHDGAVIGTVFLAWILVFVLFWRWMMKPGDIAATWTKLKAKLAADSTKETELRTLLQAKLDQAQPELNDDDRAAIAEMVALANDQ